MKPSAASTSTCSLIRTSTTQPAASTIRWRSRTCSNSNQMFSWPVTGFCCFCLSFFLLHCLASLSIYYIKSLVCVVISFHSSAKIFTTTSSSKTNSTSDSTNGNTTSTTVPAKPNLRRALPGPRGGGGGNTTSNTPQDTPSPPSTSLQLPPLLELPPAGNDDRNYLSSCSI